MGLIRFGAGGRGALGAVALLCLALSTVAYGQQQGDDRPSRPQFLEALGLLSTEPLRVDAESLGREVPLPFATKVPGSEQVRYRIKRDIEGALVGVDFAGAGNVFVESLVLTSATVNRDDESDRAFGMANLLVLRTFPGVVEAFPDARILGFGPVDLGNGIEAVQMVGTYTHERFGATVFRHVGLMPEGTDHVVVALANMSASRMPARNVDQLNDSFTGWLIRNIEFDPIAQ